MTLHTDAEVAEMLRCSPSKVKRLRLAGKIRYIPGRPALIEMDDLNLYKEQAKCRIQHPTSNDTTTAHITSTGRKAGLESASALARRLWLRRKGSSAHGC